MKCELCHKKNAETALTIEKNGKEVELYVCKDCAAAEQAKNAAKQDLLNKVHRLPNGLEVSIASLQANGSDNVPDEITAQLISAMDKLFSRLGEAVKKGTPVEDAASQGVDELMSNDEKTLEMKIGTHLKLDAVRRDFVVRDCLHLEGLFQNSDFFKIKEHCRKEKVYLIPFDAEGYENAGHVYEVRYEGSQENAATVVIALCKSEAKARAGLFREDNVRFLSDSISRALAILKNCRLLGQMELFDLLSPIRLAVLNNLLSRASVEMVDELIGTLDLTGSDCELPPEVLQKLDSERADLINKIFKGVSLNKEGKRILL